MWRSGDRPCRVGDADRRDTRARVELRQDRCDVGVDGLGSGGETLGNLGVAQALGEQQQDFELARCEAHVGGRARPRRHSSRT